MLRSVPHESQGPDVYEYSLVDVITETLSVLCCQGVAESVCVLLHCYSLLRKEAKTQCSPDDCAVRYQGNCGVQMIRPAPGQLCSSQCNLSQQVA
jgi:hypothetical protein